MPKPIIFTVDDGEHVRNVVELDRYLMKPWTPADEEENHETKHPCRV
jgi:hypothetical protein